MRPETVEHIRLIVNKHNPDLMIISDDVYGTFVDNYHSLTASLPFNTIGVYSFSKFFGVTGWRLGVITLQQKNVFDHLLKKLPEKLQLKAKKRYESLSTHPGDIRFLDRVVADSRQVALKHTSGLSTPQQVQMAFFALFTLLDKDNRYKELTKQICRHRQKLLFDSLGLDLRPDPYDAAYYTEFDLLEWATHYYGDDFAKYLHEQYKPIDILVRLAEESSIVLLNGGGFHGPEWSIRISLANLKDEDYSHIGQALHRILEMYIDNWKNSAPMPKN
ncbi:Bifunctional aspartate aminotransferase and L-aspartate beta-decarboxylase [bioreactor metagenome]|uniref:Bifunctional aspartate aminotransferase and L-aspartate beta-decarboxylase n=2 Tax=root TaxID=1 RepID=A0A644ZW46_9ZZZZ